MIKKPNMDVFQDRKKEANFWKKNFDQAWKGGKQTKVRFARNLSETINVRFDARTMSAIRDEAQGKGLGTTQLIRMWVIEKIRRGDRFRGNPA